MSTEKWKVLKVNCTSAILPIQATILGCWHSELQALALSSSFWTLWPVLSSLANNHQRSTEQVKGQALLNDFTVNIVTFSYVGMCMLTWFQCLSMMKTGPVSNGTDSLRFFGSLWFFCWLLKEAPNYHFSNGTQQTGVLEYSTEADNWMKEPWEDSC